MKPGRTGAADSSKAGRRDGLVVAAHGRRGILAQDILAEDGTRLPYLVRGRQLRVYCGDRVSYTPAAAGEPVVVETVAPRENELQRIGGRGGPPETIAANLSHLVVVMAPVPAPDLFLTDRYLCAARLMGAASAIAWNKLDLAPLPARELMPYERLGTPVLAVSAADHAGIDALRAWIGTGTAVLVGQSGVGKSSLLNVLAPDAAAATGAVSLATDEGRHTTTASVLHALPGGGALLDTPGVRDFVPAIPERRTIGSGFAEIAEAGLRCRFTDCSHLREAHCAVQDAVAAGMIDPRRYESYRRLMNLVRHAEKP